MSDNQSGGKSTNDGRQLADQVLGRRIAALQTRATVLARDGIAGLQTAAVFSIDAPPDLMLLKAASKGFLLGLGDSWFDYFAMDALDSLQNDIGYIRTSVAEAGTSLKSIAKVPAQLERLSEEIEKTVGGVAPKAILLSGGGNDLVDFGIENLLNDFGSGLPPLKENAVKQLIDEDMESALTVILNAVTALCRKWLGKTIPILIHGYDYPIPDGRPLVLPPRGPWLEKGFIDKGYDKLDLGPRTKVMKTLIDRLNEMQLTVVAKKGLEHVKHVELRGSLAAADYTTMWGNELHPTRDGFKVVARKFAKAL